MKIRYFVWAAAFALICVVAVLGAANVAYAGQNGTVPSDPSHLPPSCPALGYDDYTRLFIPRTAAYPYSVSEGGFSASINAPWDISWTAEEPVDAVIVRGGGNNVYTYDEAISGSGLASTLRPNGKYSGVKWVEFCWDEENGTIP